MSQIKRRDKTTALDQSPQLRYRHEWKHEISLQRRKPLIF